MVRFAESDGYEYDMHRPDAYRYRDYVVQSFNDDKPYDAFVRGAARGRRDGRRRTERMLVASGFNRLGPLRKNAGNQDVASSQNEVLTEMTNIVGAAFLGVTVGCARCHDHKFDPFRQSDYYRLQAHFAQTQPNDIVQASARGAGGSTRRRSIRCSSEMRRLQMQLRRAPETEKAKFETQLEELDEQDAAAALRRSTAVKDDAGASRATSTSCSRAIICNPVAKVGVRPLGILLPEATPEEPLDDAEAAARAGQLDRRPGESADRARDGQPRVELPLRTRASCPRPTISDAWARGRRTPSCWTCWPTSFVEGGWKMKPIHRMILLSSAYRQSSISPIEKIAMEKDAENALLWKFEPPPARGGGDPRLDARGRGTAESRRSADRASWSRSIPSWC